MYGTAAAACEEARDFRAARVLYTKAVQVAEDDAVVAEILKKLRELKAKTVVGQRIGKNTEYHQGMSP